MWLNDKRRRKYSKKWGVLVMWVEPRASAATSSASLFTCSISNMLQALNSDEPQQTDRPLITIAAWTDNHSWKIQAFTAVQLLCGFRFFGYCIVYIRNTKHQSHQPHEAFYVILYGSETVPNIITKCGTAERRSLFLNLKIKPFSWRVKKAQDGLPSQEVTNNILHQMDHN